MKSERRRHIRHEALDNAFAALGPKYSRVGKIKDISSGGMAFEYIARKERIPKASQVDIFLAENNFNISNLACTVVYDIVVHVPHVESQFADLLATRRCGVRFGSLSLSSRRKLRIFIENQAGTN